jgi:hypothetical protein
MHPLISFEYSVPVRFFSFSANNAVELTRLPFDSGFYSFADEVIRRNFEARKITKAIDRQFYNKLSVLDNRDILGAFTDVSDSDLMDEVQGGKDISDGPVF